MLDDIAFENVEEKPDTASDVGSNENKPVVESERSEPANEKVGADVVVERVSGKAARGAVKFAQAAEAPSNLNVNVKSDVFASDTNASLSPVPLPLLLLTPISTASADS